MATNVFFAGASGAIGRRLTPLLLEAGYNVYGLTRDPAKARELEARGVHAIVGDVYDAALLAAAVESAQAEIVLHQLTDLPQSRDDRADPKALERNARVRVEGTQNLVAAALHCGAKRIVAQSIAFAYAAGPEPHVESDPLDAQTRGSVITLERLVLASPPLIGSVLRFGSLYGPGTWYDAPAGNVALHIDAAAWATMLAIQRSAAGIFNLSEDDLSRCNLNVLWADEAQRVVTKSELGMADHNQVDQIREAKGCAIFSTQTERSFVPPLGKDIKNTLVDNLGNEIAFCQTNQEDAEILAKRIGERTLEKTSRTVSRQSNGFSTSRSYQEKEEPFFKPHILRNLKKHPRGSECVVRHCEKGYARTVLPFTTFTQKMTGPAAAPLSADGQPYDPAVAPKLWAAGLRAPAVSTT